MSTTTPNVIDHIFTTAYSYTNASGFQVQINTNLDGNVTIGNANTSYSLFLNGLTISQLVNTAYPPYNWADYPAVNTVNLSGNWLCSLSGGTEQLSVNVCGALVVNDGIDVAVGNITVVNGNFITASGNIVAHGNIAVDCNVNIGGNITLSGTVIAEGGLLYNAKSFTVDSNAGGNTYTSSNYQGINYLGYVYLAGPDDDKYLFLTVAGNCNLHPGYYVEIKTTNATLTNLLNLVTYNSVGSTYNTLYTITDTSLHKYVYFGTPGWVEL